MCKIKPEPAWSGSAIVFHLFHIHDTAGLQMSPWSTCQCDFMAITSRVRSSKHTGMWDVLYQKKRNYIRQIVSIYMDTNITTHHLSFSTARSDVSNKTAVLICILSSSSTLRWASNYCNVLYGATLSFGQSHVSGHLAISLHQLLKEISGSFAAKRYIKFSS